MGKCGDSSCDHCGTVCRGCGEIRGKLRAALEKIHEISDGRRHYRDAEGDEGLWTALGTVRDLAEEALEGEGA